MFIKQKENVDEKNKETNKKSKKYLNFLCSRGFSCDYKKKKKKKLLNQCFNLAKINIISCMTMNVQSQPQGNI